MDTLPQPAPPPGRRADGGHGFDPRLPRSTLSLTGNRMKSWVRRAAAWFQIPAGVLTFLSWILGKFGDELFKEGTSPTVFHSIVSAVGKFVATPTFAFTALIFLIVANWVFLWTVWRDRNDLRAWYDYKSEREAEEARRVAEENRLSSLEPPVRRDSIREVRYGFLEYEPMLGKDQAKNPAGFGLDLLEKLVGEPRSTTNKLGIKYLPCDDWRSWDNVLQGLNNGSTGYEIVATPLFYVPGRTSQAIFTMPLFFSNVGLFVSPGFERRVVDRIDDIGPGRKLSIRHVSQILQEFPELKFSTVRGEISELIAKIYVPHERISPHPYLGALFRELEDSKDAPFAAFLESYPMQANNPAKKKPSALVNLLNEHEILYPVCYALRRDQYQLAALLNIGLLSMVSKGTIMAMLQDSLGISPADLSRHFVVQLPPLIPSAAAIAPDGGLSAKE